MNKPPDDLRGNWSADLSGAETWRDIGLHDTWWQAGMALIDDEQCWDFPNETLPDDAKIDVGIMRIPREPETFIDADDILDKLVECDHEDYFLECAEYYLQHVPKDAKDELTFMFRNLFGQWLERHNLRPKWFVVGDRWTVTAGEIRAKAKEMQK